jgi:hypothetical protein
MLDDSCPSRERSTLSRSNTTNDPNDPNNQRSHYYHPFDKRPPSKKPSTTSLNPIPILPPTDLNARCSISCLLLALDLLQLLVDLMNAVTPLFRGLRELSNDESPRFSNSFRERWMVTSQPSNRADSPARPVRPGRPWWHPQRQRRLRRKKSSNEYQRYGSLTRHPRFDLYRA